MILLRPCCDWIEDLEFEGSLTLLSNYMNDGYSALVHGNKGI